VIYSLSVSEPLQCEESEKCRYIPAETSTGITSHQNRPQAFPREPLKSPHQRAVCESHFLLTLKYKHTLIHPTEKNLEIKQGRD